MSKARPRGSGGPVVSRGVKHHGGGCVSPAEWADEERTFDEDAAAVFAEIEVERKRDLGREIDLEERVAGALTPSRVLHRRVVSHGGGYLFRIELAP